MSNILKRMMRSIQLNSRLWFYFMTGKEILLYISQENPAQLPIETLNERTKTLYNNITLIRLNKQLYIFPLSPNTELLSSRFLKKSRKLGILKKVLVSINNTMDDAFNRYLEELFSLLENKIQLIWLPASLQSLSANQNFPQHFRNQGQKQISLMPIDKQLIHTERNPYLKNLIHLIENSDPDQITPRQFEFIWQYFYTLLEQLKSVYEFSRTYNALEHSVLINGELTEKVLTQISQIKLSKNKRHFWQTSKLKSLTTIVLIGLFLIATGNSYYKNQLALSNIYDKGTALHPQSDPLNFYALQSAYPDNFAMHFGLYQGNKLKDALGKWYENRINQTILPQLASMAKTNVQQCITQGCNDPTNSFKMYMMLVKPSHFNAEFFYQQLNNTQRSSFSPEQLQSLLNFMQQYGFRAIVPDAELDAQIITYLPSLTFAANKLINAQATSLGVVSPFAELSYLQNAQTLNIPVFYTQKGYSAYLTFKNASINNAEQLFWYYPSINKQFQTSLAAALDDAYTQHYISQWKKLINSMQIGPSNDLFNEITTLELMGKNSLNTLFKILANYALLNSFKTPLENQINAPFQGLAKLVDNESFKQTINNNFTALNGLLNKLNTSQPQDLFQFMSTAITNGSITELSDIQQTSQQLPTILHPLLTQFIQQTSQNLFNKLIPGLNTQWQHIVPDINQLLATTYPFAANPIQDSSTDQWQQMFGKDSALIVYLSQNIAPFINLTTGTPYQLYGASLPLDPSIITKLMHYQQINQLFFAGNQLAIQFTMQPVNLSSSIPRIKLILAGQALVYQHGPLLKRAFQFPKTNITSSLVWSSFAGNDVNTQQIDTWSWLKLLLTANANKINVTTWQLTFNQGNAAFVVNINSNPAIDMLFNGSLQQLQLPGSLL